MSTVPEYFGSLVFDDRVMRSTLPADVYASLRKTIDEGRELDIGVANAVAQAMKDWAVSHGATHFTHWFQPLTGITAEKHDSFISPSPDGSVIMEFSGKELIKGEPDASSFPSGGLRATFEARGYTAWDPTSYAFIKDKSLCIPTAFCSYGGPALDKKTPLLRSMEVLSKEALRILRLFGNNTAKRVVSSVGPEQEYFLITKEMYDKRPDLRFTGRTLFGAKPPKGQELDDHYFGVIKPGVQAYMADLNDELWKLGILAKTEHNEVAPAQHELAPIYTTTNIATDHNQLTMEIMQKVAAKHGLVCLLHEKPFAGVNGSGKHNNWGIAYGKRNLLDPGSNPAENAVFLTVLTAVIHALDSHSDILRTATSGLGNDHRLGANEAPPAIISMFVGEQLEGVINQSVSGTAASKSKASSLRIGIDALPPLNRDATDRNRTSPFAFTGNKFEFRAPGSSQSCAEANMILNTIVAEAMDAISDQMEKFSAKTFNADLQALLKKEISAHQRVIFNGDGYKPEWIKEATKRGLPNLPSTPEAIKPLLDKDNQKLFEKYGVLTKAELESRYEVFREDYERRLEIEARIALEIAKNMIRPVVIKEYLTMQDAKGCAAIDSVKKEMGDELDELTVAIDSLQQALAEGHGIIPAMLFLRHKVDALEAITDDNVWPLPKYREMLFIC